VTAGDRTATDGMLVFKNGQNQPITTAIGGVVTVRSFHDVPAIIFATGAVGWLKAHFFPLILAHIGNKQVSRLPIKAKAPRIAQPERPNFAASISLACKWVVGRNAV